MKIAIDIRGTHGNPGGKGIWTKNVLGALLEQSEHIFYLFSDQVDSEFSDHPQVHLIHVTGAGIGWHHRVYRLLIEHKVDLFLATESYLIPFFHDPKKLRVALVVHDLVVFKSPSKHQKKATWIERMTLKRAAKKSHFIFTVSESTKKDLIEQYPSLHLGLKTLVVYAGVRSHFLQPVSEPFIHSTLKKFKLPATYLLMASTLEPRKNFVGVIQAYAKLDGALRKKNPLVIVGKKGWYYEQIFDCVRALKVESQVHFLGYVSDEDLLALMRGAIAFLFPSFYEGFGLPVVEAMANGIPVLTSRISSLPEVGGEAVLYVDPYDIMSLTQGMEMLLGDEDGRHRLIKKGLIQSQQFSWEKTAKHILNLI